MYYQQPMGMPMQQPMGMPMGQPMGMPMMGQPAFKQIKVGNGINPNEYQSITGAATACFCQGMNELAMRTATAIKGRLGGEWFVFIGQEGDNSFNFAMTCVSGSDFMVFCLNDIQFQVLRLR